MNYRQAELIRHEGVRVRLTGYGAASGMDAHTHDYHQLSFLLAGSIRERHGGQEVETDLPSFGIKPAGLDHANDYGRDGAVILAVNIDPDSEMAAEMGEDWHWQARRPDPSLSGLIALLDDPSGDPSGVLTDLLALARKPAMERFVPDWLEQLRARLSDPDDAADFAEMAAEIGVHRVQASRSFVRHFTIPPSLYRTRCRLARAIGLMGRDEGLAEIAAAAGFADQAHLSRTMKRQLGRSPRDMRELIPAA
ncbi:helix-turn-helix domain-containing protein [Maricaulis parjimensis]|uniref:helix-turn-helix domain-containing protein n=1 Tax=Maricaulis parjimensis TaxID=144023 RepID=UPI00193ACE84|nr:helix-turn-helix domain-containing protein [Maricaulis parjimensis]